MRARGFRWSQATVWSIEKGERPLRLSEAEAVMQAVGKPFFDLTAEDGEAVIGTWMSECSEASQELDAAIDRFERARFNLATCERYLPEHPTRRYADAGGWLQVTIEDLVTEHRDKDRGDEGIVGELSGFGGTWVEQYNATIRKEYPNVERQAED